MAAITESETLIKIIPLVITGIISLIIGTLLEKFKTRLAVLKYKISFQSIGTSSQIDHWGAIEVYHNKRLTKHLNFVTIEIENSSKIDQQDLNIDVSCDQQSQFLGYSAFYNVSNTAILLEQNHFDYYSDVLRRNQNDIDQSSQNPNHITPPGLTNEINWVQTNKKFHLPVFNRKSKVTINLLVENFRGIVPSVDVNVLHKSVQILKDTDSDEELHKTLFWTFGVGLAVFTLGLVLLLNHYSSNKEPVIITGMLGLFYSLIGFGILLIFRFIRRILS